MAKNSIIRNAFSNVISHEDKIDTILTKIRKEGIYVLPNFMPREECISLVSQIDDIISTRPDDIWKDDLGADHRLWGMDRISEQAKNFYCHHEVKDLRSGYYNLEDRFLQGFTMANRIEAMEGNLGSGGGWHRDVVNEKQLKAILYLTDVDEEHGPFQYILGTQEKDSVTRSILDHNFAYNHNRFSNEDVEKILSYPEYASRIFTGKAGTLIIADTSGVHRGMPILKGKRYAMTNYCWISPEKGGNGMPKKVYNLLLN